MDRQLQKIVDALCWVGLILAAACILSICCVVFSSSCTSARRSVAKTLSRSTAPPVPVGAAPVGTAADDGRTFRATLAIPSGYVECQSSSPHIHWWAPDCPVDPRRGFVVVTDPSAILYGDLYPPRWGDGDLDVDDILQGLAYYEVADPAMDLQPCGGDGDVDSDDLFALLRAFKSGGDCVP